MEYEKFDKLSEDKQNKLRSIARRLKKINKEIEELGYTVYLAPGHINIMDGATHEDKYPHTALYENIVLDVDTNLWNGGDW